MIDKKHLYNTFKKCWSIESSSKWEKGCPSKGQCSVTALVVHDYFGGKILKTKVNGNWHFYNKVDNQTTDITSDQFSSPIEYQDIESSAEEAFSDTSKKQYEHLSKQFSKYYIAAIWYLKIKLMPVCTGMTARRDRFLSR